MLLFSRQPTTKTKCIAKNHSPQKKALKEAVAAGKKLTVFQPNGMFGAPPVENGKVCLEGPNFQMHKWYAQATIENGVIVKVS